MSQLENNNSKVLNDIQSLQELEKQLISNLETHTGLNTKQQQEILKKINSISQMRINLYKTLSGLNNYFKTSLNNSRVVLNQQTNAISIVEKELNNSKQRLNLLTEEKNNKIRLIQINSYYSDKYSEQSAMLRYVMLYLILCLVFTLLYNKGFLPYRLYILVLILLTLIFSFIIFSFIFSISSRDKMNYQKYNWEFDPQSAPSNIGANLSRDIWSMPSADLTTCIGEMCCSKGQIYDSALDKCIVKK